MTNKIIQSDDFEIELNSILDGCINEGLADTINCPACGQPFFKDDGEEQVCPNCQHHFSLQE